MIDVLIWIALTMSIGTAILAVWVFNHLASGGIIVGDSYNSIELWASMAILVLLIIALVCFTIKNLRE